VLNASLRRLGVFRAVVETGRFSSAAATLGIAQPAVTAHINALEKAVGQPLLMRGPGRAPRLTKAGEAVYTYALEVIRRSDETIEVLRTLESPTARVVLGMLRSLTRSPLPKHLASFQRKNPKTKIAVRCETNDDVLNHLRDGTVDIGIFTALGPVGDMQTDVIGSERFIFVVAPTHPLAKRRKIVPRELSDYGFIGGLPESQFSHMLQTLLRRLGIQSVEFVIEVQQVATTAELASHGVGIAFISQSSVVEELQLGRLVPLSINAEPIHLEVRWAATPRRAVPPASLDLIRHLRTNRTFGPVLA
jgi:DNA-binding transcriptional LysR family regulator